MTSKIGSSDAIDEESVATEHEKNSNRYSDAIKGIIS